MAITKMASYDLKGVKFSFADWISNLSPTETPFCSMTGKEAISQTKFQWQSDTIPSAKDDHDVQEGSVPTFEDPTLTEVMTNNTQIFRRAVSVSDTANHVATYGRSREIGYQMEKAGLEIKRDMEKAFLWQDHAGTPTNGFVNNGTAASNGTAPLTAGFIGLCAKKGVADADTGAVVYKHTGAAVTDGFSEDKIFDMTYQLYLANSKANVIMFHPKHAGDFSRLLSVSNPNINRMKMFKEMDDTYNVEVDTIVDPLGQKFALIPNRQMPENYLYFFNPSDWTQMVLRAPKKVKLAKVGSSEEWVIEAEIGLRHRNRFASGILKADATA